MWLEENIPDKCVWAIIKLFSTRYAQNASTSRSLQRLLIESHNIDFTMIWQKIIIKKQQTTVERQWLVNCKRITSNDRLKTLMNGDVSLSLIGCFFVIKSNIAIFRQLHYLQHKRPWEFSVWTRTATENNPNHSCKNGPPPLVLPLCNLFPLVKA